MSQGLFFSYHRCFSLAFEAHNNRLALCVWSYSQGPWASFWVSQVTSVRMVILIAFSLSFQTKSILLLLFSIPTLIAQPRTACSCPTAWDHWHCGYCGLNLTGKAEFSNTTPIDKHCCEWIISSTPHEDKAHCWSPPFLAADSVSTSCPSRSPHFLEVCYSC